MTNRGAEKGRRRVKIEGKEENWGGEKKGTGEGREKNGGKGGSGHNLNIESKSGFALHSLHSADCTLLHLDSPLFFASSPSACTAHGPSTLPEAPPLWRSSRCGHFAPMKITPS